ncbi:MAG: helix-turn-helix domain-containing protein [Clostridiales bacterium]|nr:helix-turn-helix domain-containing protein [Clostridiales bacterium]
MDIKTKIIEVEDCVRRKIRQYCTQEKISLYAFALEAKISYSTLRDFMNEKTEPKLGTLVLIADYMGLTLSKLVELEESG